MKLIRPLERLGCSNVFIILFLMLLPGCMKPAYKMPIHHSPLLNGNWNPIFPKNKLAKKHQRSSKPKSPKNNSKIAVNKNLRQNIIGQITAILNAQKSTEGYGTEDIRSILQKEIPQLSWPKKQSLEQLVAKADAKNAYFTDTDAKPGDIILFHNQRDTNGNGKLDDWMTGCGILVDWHKKTMFIITRTGNKPKKIIAWPDGPAVDRVDDRQINSFLRIPHRSDPRHTEYLAGQLYAGYIDIDALAKND